MNFQSIRLFYLVILMMSTFPLFSQVKRPSTPNFIIIYCDNLGYGDIGPFGSEVNRTPYLDRMAEDISSKHDVAKENPLIVKELLNLADKARLDLGDFGQKGAHQRSPGKVENPVPVTMN